MKSFVILVRITVIILFFGGILLCLTTDVSWETLIVLAVAVVGAFLVKSE